MLLAVVLVTCSVAANCVGDALGTAITAAGNQQPSSWTGCSCDSSEDPSLIAGLLEDLSASSSKFLECRQQLLRQQHHVPIVLKNPFGDIESTAWQAACAVLALMCALLLAKWRASKRQLQALQQHMQAREVAFRRVVGNIQAITQQREGEWQAQHEQWREKEAAWQQGMQVLSDLVQQRDAALSDQQSAPELQATVKVTPARHAFSLQ